MNPPTINDRVTVSLAFQNRTISVGGFVSGIAWETIGIRGYIVTLDKPLEFEGFKGWTTVCVTLDQFVA